MKEISNNDDGCSTGCKMSHVHETIVSITKKLNNLLDICNNEASWNGSQGISLLDVKNDSMLTYLISLTSLVLKKSKGQSIEDVETRNKMVYMRLILEKILPIEEKMKTQIDRMIKLVVAGKSDVSDKNSYRANINDLESNSSEDEDEKKIENKRTVADVSQKKEVYKPPKLTAVPYNDETKAEKQRKLLENAKRRALNSSVMQELKEEYLDTPLEVTTGITLRNTHTKYQKERESFEETYFTRLPLTKKEKHREKLMSSLTLGRLGNEITRFEDISALEGRLPNSSKKRQKTLGKNKNKYFKRRKTL